VRVHSLVKPRKARSWQPLVELLESREVLSATSPSTPLNDLGTGLYNGQQGGLYANGSNMRPAAVEQTAETIASQTAPLDANGNVDVGKGKVVMISIGMSNTTMEFDGGAAAFEPRANADASKNSQLVIVDGAQSGHPASDWASPYSGVWNTLLTRLRAAGVTADQVQVAWIKQAEAMPARFGGFLPAAQKLQTDLEAIA